MQEKLNDELLGGDEISKMYGATGFKDNFEAKEFPEQLQCDKCGRLITREEFSRIANCPGCGGGLFKAVKDSGCYRMTNLNKGEENYG